MEQVAPHDPEDAGDFAAVLVGVREESSWLFARS
jgi:hypothetical protein